MEEEVLIVGAGLAAGIILITVIIILAVKKKKFNKKYAKVKPQLDAWINQAKATGYNYTHIATFLQLHDWDKKIVEKALKENGMEKPAYYDQINKKVKKNKK